MSSTRPSFREVFVTVGQEELDKARPDRQVIVSVAPLLTGLLVVAAVLYYMSPYATLVTLCVALVVLWERWVLTRQATRDLEDMRRAKAAYERGQQPEECAEFIRLRSAQMLTDNKMLSATAQAEIQALQDWAQGR